MKVFETNLVTLSHATELAAKVILSVAGEEISTSIRGKQQTAADIKSVVVAKLQANLIANRGA